MKGPNARPTETGGDPRRFAGALGCLVLAGGAVSVAGWVFGIDRLKDWFGAGIAIKANTAVGVMSVGAALALASGPLPSSGVRLGFAGSFGAIAAVLGGMTLLEHLTRRQLGIDELLFDDAPGARATTSPGRMGPPAATSLLLLGTALIVAVTTRSRAERRFSKRSVAPALAIVVLAISLLSTSGYLFGAKSLYEVAGLTGIALQTALMLLASAVAVMFCVPDREPARTLFEAGSAGTIARRAVPFVIALPILLGWLRTKGEALGLYGVETGRSLLILSLIGCLSGLLWWAVVGIRKSERLMRETDLRLAQELRKMQRLHAVSVRLGSSDQGTDPMLELLDTALTLADADSGTIQLFENGRLKTVASRGFEDRLVAKLDAASAGADPRDAGLRVRTAMEDITSAPGIGESPLRSVMLEAGVRALRATPLIGASGETLGILSTHYRTRTVPSEHDLRMVDLLARLVAQWVERMRADGERKQNEAFKARLAAIVESSDDAVISKDLNGVITSWNASAERLFGYSEQEAIGHPITMLMPPARYDEERLILQRIRRGERVEHYETVRQRKDGTLLDLSLTVSPIRDASGKVVGASKIARDISARKRSEDALRDSEERFRSLVSVITDVPWTSDAGGGFVSPQPSWSAYTGQKWEDLHGHGWMDALHPDDRDEMAAAWVMARKSGAVYEARGRLWHAASNRYRSVVARATPRRDRAGVVREWVGAYTDVEEQVRAKEHLQTLLEERTAALRESMSKLHDSQRLLALGNLAAGLGHDIANMVLPIRARLAVFEQICTTEDARGDLEAIGQTLAHLTSLSAGLRLMALDPSRRLASTEATDLELWWLEAQGVMRASLPRPIRLVGSIAAGLSVVMPRHQLTQAVFNLVRNAGEALAGTSDGIVTVEAGAVTADDGRRWTTITVSDNGHGLSPEALARCFEPYFSTKGRSIATGMGLAMVRGLVESAGGTVSVKSEPGSGASFTITLPPGEGVRVDDTPRPRVTARTAAITVQDPRTSALAAMMLEGLDVGVFHHEPPGAPGDPDADLWVAHDPEPESLGAFIAADARRRAVVIRSPSWDPGRDGTTPFPGDRVFVVAFPSPPAVLRDVLSAAVVTAGRPANPDQIHGAGVS